MKAFIRFLVFARGDESFHGRGLRTKATTGLGALREARRHP